MYVAVTYMLDDPPEWSCPSLGLYVEWNAEHSICFKVSEGPVGWLRG